MAESRRANTLNQVAEYILNLKRDHPIRVGIDGITGSGKSSFARELSERLAQFGRAPIHATLDGFHNPRVKRHQRGRESAEGYYFDAYDYSAVAEHLLKPLGPFGDLKYKTKIFDLSLDSFVDSEFSIADSQSILIVDGSFSLRPELRPFWEVGIYLKVGNAIAEERVVIRDADLFGSSELARQTTKSRYHGAHAIHSRIADPEQVADFVIDNEDFLFPKILKWQSARP